MTDSPTPKQAVGCIGAVITLLLSLPLWYALLFGILIRIEAPNWMWICYWLYLPAGVITTGVTKLAESWEDD